MNTFLQYNPTKLFFGEDQIKQIPNELENNLNVLVVYGGGSIKQTVFTMLSSMNFNK